MKSRRLRKKHLPKLRARNPSMVGWLKSIMGFNLFTTGMLKYRNFTVFLTLPKYSTIVKKQQAGVHSSVSGSCRFVCIRGLDMLYIF